MGYTRGPLPELNCPLQLIGSWKWEIDSQTGLGYVYRPTLAASLDGDSESVGLRVGIYMTATCTDFWVPRCLPPGVG